MNKKIFKEIERTTQTMGMAASQARLLTITARLSDNELRSQTINNAKMRLATQSSQASEAYINALNNATLQFTNYDETGAVVTQPLTFNSLMNYSSYNTQYGITNTSGQLLVSEAEARMFEAANGNLEEYLKAHGLEYTTTYFENIPALSNAAYPEPFNQISTEDLKQWYEEYGSYENSIEVETYENAYNEYVSAKRSLTTSINDPLGKALKNALNAEAEIKDSSSIGTLKNAINNSSNSFSYKNSLLSQFINQNGKDEIDKLLKAYNQPRSNLANLEVTNTFQMEEDADGNKVLRFEEVEITVDKNNNVKKVEFDLRDEGEEEDENEAKTKITYDGNTLSSGYTFSSDVTLEEFLNKATFAIGDDNGNTYLNISKPINIDNDNVSLTFTYMDNEAIKDQIEYFKTRYIDLILNNIDYSKLAQVLKATPTLASELGLSDSGIEELATRYSNAQDTFLKNIFKDIDSTKYEFEGTTETIKDAIENGHLSMMDLLDEEYVLILAKDKGIELAESFHTVIKNYLVEMMMADYGTPNYAWVDENDIHNTGNADAKAQWYTNLFHRMERGYKALENGLASSYKWLEYAIESGIVMLEQVDKSYNWQSLEFKTCTRITEVTDEAAVAKAEAEYTRAMNDIKAKDSIYDIQLKNIDTEHTALQTEYDSIKKVIDKNIDRTFKFSQNG